MLFSFIDIEEHRRQIIFSLFAFLVLFYFFSFWVLTVTIKIVGVTFGINLHSTGLVTGNTTTLQQYLLLNSISLLVIFFIALTVGFLHWYFSTSIIREKLLTLLKARYPDKEDKYH